MDYHSVIGSYIGSPSAPEPPPFLSSAGRARRLRDAIEPIAMHAVWSPTTNARLAAFGLSFFGGYVWGRAAALGEPPAEVVVAAFGVFEPGRLAGAYEEARTQVARTDLLRARTEATIESLDQVLPGGDIRGAVAVLRRGLEAADGSGRPLFSGLRSLGWPDQPVGQLWRACDLFREHRGDSHIAACITAGLDPVEMNVLTELWVGVPLGSYTATRGWSPDVIAAATDRLRARGRVTGASLTDDGRRFRKDIEDRTDAMQQPILDAIGDDFDPLVARLDGWSAACIEAKTFPTSVHKRAAG